jgi:hypothetical protein
MKRTMFRLNAGDIGLYGIGLIVVTVIVGWQYAFYLFDYWDYPLWYQGDGLLTMSFGKMFADGHLLTGTKSVLLNYPFGTDLTAWYPVPEKLMWYPFGLLIKLFGVYSASNLLLYLAHTLAALFFIYAARTIGASRLLSLAGGIVYGCAPFIFARGLAHPAVGHAWLVPLMIVVVWKLSEVKSNVRDLPLKRMCFCVAVLGAMLSPYYLLMFLQFMAMLIVIKWVRREYGLMLSMVKIVAISIIVVAVVNYPLLINIFQYGNSGIRDLVALEVYGLKLPELFLPASYNKIPYFSEIAHGQYYRKAFVRGEVWGPYLGVAGILCCIYFVVHQAYNGIKNPVYLINSPLLQSIWIVLFSLIGGINLVIGTLGFQFIRATNRYSIWLLAIFLLYTLFKLNNISFKKVRTKKIFDAAILIVALCFVWLDLPIRYNEQSRGAIAAQVDEDIKLLDALQQGGQAEISAYVIPNQVFPENGPTFLRDGTVSQMLDYDHMRIFLNSKNVKINYGGVKTSKDTPTLLLDYDKDIEGVLKTLESYEFDYLLINKKGLSASHFDDLTDRLTALVGTPVGTISGYGIHRLSAIEQSNSTVTYEPAVTYVTGWSQPESLDGKTWRWAIANNTRIFISCSALCRQANKNVELKFGIQSFAHARDISIFIDNEEVWSGTVDSQIKEARLPLFVKEDNHEIIIEATGELETPGGGDSRTLSFSLHDLEIRKRP